MAGPVRIAILGNASSAVGAIHKTEAASRSLGSRFASLTKAAAKYATVGVGAIAVAGVKLAEMAVDDSKSVALMATAFRNSADATDAQIASTEEWITAQGKALGITDDELRPALSRLVGATESVTKARRLATIAEDVAVGRGKSLATVTEAIAKGQQGSLAGLARLGVATKDQAGNTKTLSQITSELAQKYRGAAATAADTAAGKFQRVKTELSETAEAIGYDLLPVATDLGDWLLNTGVPGAEKLATTARKELGPAVQDLTGWVTENRDEFVDLGQEILGAAIPAMRQLGGIAGDVLGFFTGLPDPVKRFAGEVALAAVVVPKLSSALGLMKLQSFITDLQSAEARTKALTSAVKTAAGGAGIGLLIDSAQRGDSALGLLESAAGGAAAGFAVGGPWGALIGGGAGTLIPALRELASGSDDVAGSMQAAKPQARDFASTLDDVTAASTKATRALALQALQERGSLDQGIALGLSQRTLVDATLGRRDALAVVRAAIEQYSNAEALATSASEAAIGAQGGFRPAYSESSKAIQKQAAAAEGLSNSLGALTPQFRDQTRETRAQIAATTDYTGKLKGIPKEVRTEILENGIEPTKQAIAELVDRYDLARKDVKTLIAATGVDATVGQIQRVIDRLAAVKDKTVRLTTITRTVPAGIPGENRPVNTPGDAGRKQAEDYLAGLVVGFQGTEGIGAGIDKVLKFIEKSFADRFAQIRKNLNKTLDGKELEKALAKAETKIAKQQARVLKNLRDNESAVKAVGRAQDANNAALEKAVGDLTAMKDTAAAYAASIRDSVVEFGNLTGLGGDQGFSSADQLITLLKGKVDQAKEFANMIDALRAAHLSETAIQQLINAGVEGGMGTARAILAGGPAAISQINVLQTQLAAAGTQLGGNTATALYGAGIQAAQGLVDGLAANADVLAAQATRLAKALVKAVKKALGINSPSTVFKGLGKNAVQGLALGLDEIYVRRQGRALASSLEQGFGSPALAAFLEVRAAEQKASLEVKLTAEQQDALSRGRAIQLDLDVFRANGGR